MITLFHSPQTEKYTREDITRALADLSYETGPPHDSPFRLDKSFPCRLIANVAHKE